MNRPKVTIIDYGVGNLLSVKRGLEKSGAEVLFASNPSDVFSAKSLVLPGVGAFRNAMKELDSRNLIGAIQESVRKGIPLLGICLGMQLLLDESEEFGITPGLGLIHGRVLPVPEMNLDHKPQKIPHIGWNGLVHGENLNSWAGTILEDNLPNEEVYFVHSFMSVPENLETRLADCYYGGHRISAVISEKKITGCQFHPEKSGEVGLKVLKRFCGY